jgi:hypothetical protein
MGLRDLFGHSTTPSASVRFGVGRFSEQSDNCKQRCVNTFLFTDPVDNLVD